ncbi:diguanylate cyclase (GGDEF)-like protein [Nocardioides thalensis]|uniref:Diguanylate cyclase (GGDEF)-like protein n=1 Tax=Nocardioides thalensis TaxID=1914755 RepID=A0A853C741_9ACTN|nr:EAL domain-containing protein [Nocardioides thalensis]NYJ02961.1 diguanylate cyclase (GGDEF)-like protein [Nocardioides thalensis]
MTSPPPGTATEPLAERFHVLVCLAGLAVFAVAAVETARSGVTTPSTAVITILLIVVVARVPLILDRDDGAGIEVGFDSSILMFLLCTHDAHEALAIWSVGVLATQLTSGKRWPAKVFNTGVGILAGALATGVLDMVRAEMIGAPRELIAVALGATAYFLTDYVLSAIAVWLQSGARFWPLLVNGGTAFAFGCFVPFDTLGYLGAVVYRDHPWWTQAILAIPLVTLLVATRAVTRGRENARRLTVLFDASVRAQRYTTRDAVLTGLVEDGRRLLKLKDVDIRATAPGDGEIGAAVQRGTECWIVARATDRARSTVAADQEALRALAAVASDAWSRIELNEEMVHVARHDPLTDLPNRGILVDKVNAALEAARIDGRSVALIFFDLDGFKPINDRFGHATGDQVLIELARRIRACLGEHDEVARVGGDEFAILVDGHGTADPDPLWARTLAAIEAGIDVPGQQIHLSASAGVAYGGAGDSAESLLRRADLAMYEAKSAGSSDLVVYDDAIGRRRLGRLVLADDLRAAVAEGEIDVVYQPIVAVDDLKVVGFEALARWQRDGKQIRPDLFISVAEENGLIVPLGDVVLAKVATDVGALRVGAGSGPPTVTVNVSPSQLLHPGFVASVETAVAAARPFPLVLEITEREDVTLTAGVLDAMSTIAAMGVRFAVDDFGVGFSSMSYLTDLPVSFVKVDASLTAGIDVDERARTLLRSVAVMGQTLGLGVVVEGIERESQLATLREDTTGLTAQGYLFHRPMPVGELRRVLGEQVDAGAGGFEARR